jgi:hypothetical protein
MADHCKKLDAKYEELTGSVAKMKADAAGEKDMGPGENDLAQLVAADRRTKSDSVDPAAFASLAFSVAELKKRQSRSMADLNAFADAQAKADLALRHHDQRAEPPMAGEDLVSYQIRQHRGMQKHSPRWKGVELSLIAADRQALDNVLSEIRADTVQAGLNPVGLPPFQHREMTTTSPTGHKVTTFVGNGTMFAQLSRPVRHVGYIGNIDRTRGQAVSEVIGVITLVCQQSSRLDRRQQSDADDSIRNDLEGRFCAKKSRLGVITSGSSAWSFTGPLPGCCSCEVC